MRQVSWTLAHKATSCSRRRMSTGRQGAGCTPWARVFAVGDAPSAQAEANRAAHARAVVRAVPVWVLVQVLLVVVLGEVELASRLDLRADLAVPRLGQPLLVGGGGLLSLRPLLRAVIEDRRPVLGADVIALPHALGGVVRLPEIPEQLGVADLRRIEHHAHGLRVPGTARADLLICRVRGESSLIADCGRDDSGDLPEHL